MVSTGIIIVLVVDLLMGFQDVAFLLSRDSFSKTFCEDCGRGEILGAATCLRIVMGVNKAFSPSITLVPRNPFLCQSDSVTSYDFHIAKVNLATLDIVDITKCKTVTDSL